MRRPGVRIPLPPDPKAFGSVAPEPWRMRTSPGDGPMRMRSAGSNTRPRRVSDSAASQRLHWPSISGHNSCQLWQLSEPPRRPDLSKANEKVCKYDRPEHQHADVARSEEHTSELQSQFHLVCRLLLEKKKKN